VDEGVFGIQMAVDEACTNIIKYSYPEQVGLITITCEVGENSLTVVINDKGKPFDPNSVLPPDLEASLDKRSIGGLGIHLMRKYMDDVSYNYEEGTGNTLVMKRILAEKS
jgi:serine/threonine-protein kinase RsbW